MQFLDTPHYLLTQEEFLGREEQFDKLFAQAEADKLSINRLNSTNTELLAEIARLQGSEPTEPPTPGFPVVPFTIPPLLLNKPFFGFDSGFGTDRLEVNVSQVKQSVRRVVRRDYGLQDPEQPTGGGGFLREPIGKDMRYAITVHVPDYYRPVDMNNVFQIHTHIGGGPPYLSFFLWTTSSRWRHIQPNGQAIDINVAAIKLGHAYRLEVAAKWSRGTDGYLKVWQDGEIELDYRGPTIRAMDGAGPYVLFGQYYPAVSAEFNTTLFFSSFQRSA